MLNYIQRYASFGIWSSEKNARTTNACAYYVSTYQHNTLLSHVGEVKCYQQTQRQVSLPELHHNL